MMRSVCLVCGFLLWSAAAAAQQYVISTYAGGGPPLLTPALGVDVPIESESGVAIDTAGNIYFLSADSVLKLDQSGVITRVAGSTPGYSGDGGPATNARFRLRECCVKAAALAVDNAGNLFI